MKYIISEKRTTDIELILLTETCNIILQGMKIHVKDKDMDYVTIPCTIGDIQFKKALIDLGASMSLMPFSIYRKLGIGTIQDTRMKLQFIYHSVKRPYSIVEDILVKIDKFMFPDDFVILEMSKGRCMIDIEDGTVTLKVYDEELKIDVQNTMRYKDDVETSNIVKVLDIVIAQSIQNQIFKLPLERVLSLSA
ncbi:uncharacterized protein LOC127079191 [Lathyrus oleraceus]|uniref:uncharacterized protein LOC127079191 n=1 Tax=Pisum sativum TaxID=3888 RepID=UPI0021CF99E4|nr:uncharacterized protein LOC127079191 [Pisum sativum]